MLDACRDGQAPDAVELLCVRHVHQVPAVQEGWYRKAVRVRGTGGGMIQRYRKVEQERRYRRRYESEVQGGGSREQDTTRERKLPALRITCTVHFGSHMDPKTLNMIYTSRANRSYFHIILMSIDMGK